MEKHKNSARTAGVVLIGSRCTSPWQSTCIVWLTRNSRVILEKLFVVGLVKKFQNPYAIRQFITVVGITRHSIVIQFMSSIFKAHFNKRVDVIFQVYQSFQIFLYLQVFQLQVNISPLRVTCQFYPPFSSIPKFVLCKVWKLWISLSQNFPCLPLTFLSCNQTLSAVTVVKHKRPLQGVRKGIKFGSNCRLLLLSIYKEGCKTFCPTSRIRPVTARQAPQW